MFDHIPMVVMMLLMILVCGVYGLTVIGIYVQPVQSIGQSWRWWCVCRVQCRVLHTQEGHQTLKSKQAFCSFSFLPDAFIGQLSVLLSFVISLAQFTYTPLKVLWCPFGKGTLPAGKMRPFAFAMWCGWAFVTMNIFVCRADLYSMRINTSSRFLGDTLNRATGRSILELTVVPSGINGWGMKTKPSDYHPTERAFCLCFFFLCYFESCSWSWPELW